MLLSKFNLGSSRNSCNIKGLLYVHPIVRNQIWIKDYLGFTYFGDYSTEKILALVLCMHRIPLSRLGHQGGCYHIAYG